MTGSLRDRFGVVTGAGSGIGRETARLLGAEGMRLALLDIDGDRLDETVALLPEGTRVRALRTDVRDQQSVTAAAHDAVGFGGTPSLLVNSAGILGPHDSKVWELSVADWQAVLAVNLFGTVNTVRAFLPGMRAASRSGHIVIIASLAGLLPEARAAAYGAAKHALVAYAETLEHQLAEENSPIGVSLVCPGAVATDFNLALRTSADFNGRSRPDLLGAEAVAQRIMAAIQRPTFYVFTHPGSRERLDRYHGRLIASRDQPAIPAEPDSEGQLL